MLRTKLRVGERQGRARTWNHGKGKGREEGWGGNTQYMGKRKGDPWVGVLGQSIALGDRVDEDQEFISALRARRTWGHGGGSPEDTDGRSCALGIAEKEKEGRRIKGGWTRGGPARGGRFEDAHCHLLTPLAPAVEPPNQAFRNPPFSSSFSPQGVVQGLRQSSRQMAQASSS